MSGLTETKHCCTVCDAKKKCHVCGNQTLLACSDCAIDLSATVYVCGNAACRLEHDTKCPATIARLTERCDAYKEALEAMVEEKVDYMRINKLGDPEKQHTIKQARAALATLRDKTP